MTIVSRTFTLLVTILGTDYDSIPDTEALAKRVQRELEEGTQPFVGPQHRGYDCATVDAFAGDVIVGSGFGGQSGAIKRARALHDDIRNNR